MQSSEHTEAKADGSAANAAAAAPVSTGATATPSCSGTTSQKASTTLEDGHHPQQVLHQFCFIQ